MYEIEYKVELSEAEKSAAIELFKQKGFTNKGVDLQNDYYVEAKDSPLGGYDLKRYRDTGDTVVYTEKVWEIVEAAGGQQARKETEHEVSREEFTLEIAKYPDAVKIKKQRESFETTWNDLDVHLSIDSVKFDHSPSMRYFIEAETISPDKNKVKEYKEILKDFLKELLGKEELIEAWGMFTMALKQR